MKSVSKKSVIYAYSVRHKPAIHVEPGEIVIIETEDAFGGQVKSEEDVVSRLDWSRVDGATGPVFVEGAEPGDTLVVEVLHIDFERRGVIATVPKYGILGKRDFKASTKFVELNDDYVDFDKHVRVRLDPMIGTIGVTPAKEFPTGSLVRHGGNVDVKELKAGSKLYLPVFVPGGLFAAGDLHAIQADGELCVSAIEVAGEILLRFRLVKDKSPEWPVLETKDSFALLGSGSTLDEAAEAATEAAVKALMREHGWTFEVAYMFGSIAVELRINQVVDPMKGIRAVISKDHITLQSLLVPKEN